MLQIKVFTGENGGIVENKANVWLSHNPNIRIKDVIHQVTPYYGHTITITMDVDRPIEPADETDKPGFKQPRGGDPTMGRTFSTGGAPQRSRGIPHGYDSGVR